MLLQDSSLCIKPVAVDTQTAPGPLTLSRMTSFSLSSCASDCTAMRDPSLCRHKSDLRELPRSGQRSQGLAETSQSQVGLVSKPVQTAGELLRDSNAGASARKLHWQAALAWLTFPAPKSTSCCSTAVKSRESSAGHRANHSSARTVCAYQQSACLPVRLPEVGPLL